MSATLQQKLMLVQTRSDADYRHPYSIGQSYVYRWRELMGMNPEVFAEFCESLMSNKNWEFSVQFADDGKRLQLFNWTYAGSSPHLVSFSKLKVHSVARDVLKQCLVGSGANMYIMDHPLPEQE